MELTMKLLFWEKVEIFKDEDEKVTKFVFTKQDAVVETVLYRYPVYEERTVVCHSVMSGCPIGCSFCGTGEYFVRNLTYSEILEQIYFALNYTKVNPLCIKKLQIMSMSMGEPMLNKSIENVYRRLYTQYPSAALLLSTSGPSVDYSGIFSLAKQIPTMGLQFSIHESTDEKRNKLIPFAAKLNLSEIANKGSSFFEHTGRRPFFNYCAHEGNSSRVDAFNLTVLFDPKIWEATVSVICEKEEGILSKQVNKELASTFSQYLVELGFNVRVFDPAGQDTIGGGCGQLWFVQDWMKNNPDKIKPSIGNKNKGK